MILTQTLEEAGFQIVGTAADGYEAIDKARALRPDVITMDLSMPVLDGISAMIPILHDLPQVKIIVITALGYADRMEASLKAGAIKFLTKPLDYELLKQQIIEALID